MIEAEEYGINSANADMMKTSDNPQIKRLVGSEGEMGAAFGLDNDSSCDRLWCNRNRICQFLQHAWC
jgi:hypothetical protein